MKELVKKINAEAAVFAANADVQASKGNKAAGLRARKAALVLIKERSRPRHKTKITLSYRCL